MFFEWSQLPEAPTQLPGKHTRIYPHWESVQVCTITKIAMHGARRLHMSKRNRAPVHDAHKGEYPMHGAWQTSVLSAH